MLLGIDVGGTFTDAAAIVDGAIIAHAKSPTTDDLLTGILASLDKVLAETAMPVERVALSTTFVTNALVQGRISPVGLLLIPGPGMDCSGLLPVQPVILDGYIDHRGREAAPVRAEQVKAACRQLADFDAIAISGKFSVRNPQQEAQVADWVAECLPHCHITRGAEVSGGLNFPRRTNSAYYNAAVWRTFGLFADAAETAIRRRGIQAPVYILKADGGTLPLHLARRFPVETVWTGPAASVLGIKALTNPQGQAVSLDIGGTTTDIALWQDGTPLAAPHGVNLAGYATAVRSFRLHSIGIGGDSVIRRSGAGISVGPDRLGSAAALGGTAPTLSDAMIVTGHLRFGNPERSAQALETLVGGQSIIETAQQILATAVDMITREIQTMMVEHAAEPVYRVEDMNRQLLRPDQFIVVGGAGKGLALLLQAAWSKQTGRDCILDIPSAAVIANAVGAAIAKPTLTLTVRADTEQRMYSVPELGIRQPLEGKVITADAVKQLAASYLVQQAGLSGIDADALETILFEEFNMVRGFRTVGKQISVKLQVTPGVLMPVNGKEVVI